MRIAIDARFYRSETGGIGRYTQNLIQELAKIDHKNQYTVFITPKDEAEFTRLTHNFQQTTFNKQLLTNNFKKEVIPIGHYSIAEQTKFLKILNQRNFDLVHFLNFNHPIFYKKPFITTIHDLTMLLYPAGNKQKSFINKFAFKIVMKHAVKCSHVVIADSQATKKDCVRYFNARPKNIKVVYAAADSIYDREIQNTSFSQVKRAENLSLDSGQARMTNPNEANKLMKLKSYLLFVSQWRPHKGLPELIKAFEILKSKYKIPHQLVITGKPNPDFPEITYNIQHSTFNKDIITPGFVSDSDLPILYQNATAFIFPSFYEGFGLPPLEAMACGTPVISSNLSCMPEILGNAAEYFDPHNINKMASVINKVLIDKKLQEKMSKAGLEHIKKYSWKKMAKETLEVYQKATKI